jgi:hypothetical protein
MQVHQDQYTSCTLYQISGRCVDLSIAVHSARDDPSDVYTLFISPDKPTCTQHDWKWAYMLICQIWNQCWSELIYLVFPHLIVHRAWSPLSSFYAHFPDSKDSSLHVSTGVLPWWMKTWVNANSWYVPLVYRFKVLMWNLWTFFPPFPFEAFYGTQYHLVPPVEKDSYVI